VKGIKGVLIAAVLIWLAAGLNMGVAGKIAILGGNPDFLLITMGTLGLFSSRLGGAWLGFFCGFVYGSLAGANLTQYIISRTIGGFAAGWLNDAGFQGSIGMAGLSAVIVTLISQLLLMFSAPPNDVASFLGDTIRMALYNGVLAMPFYVGLSKILEPQQR
jgi:rod shape-determining protein MreD